MLSAAAAALSLSLFFFPSFGKDFTDLAIAQTYAPHKCKPCSAGV